MAGKHSTAEEMSAQGEGDTPEIIYPQDHPPPFKNLFYAVQHVFAMFGATVLGPLLMGFDPNTAILFSGMATLIFYAFLYDRVPSYLGSSFSFIAAVNLATGFAGIPGQSNPNLAIALGGIVAAGAIYFAIGALVNAVGYKWLDVVMPPVVSGAIVGVIGLNLAPSAVQEVSGPSVNMAFGFLTVALVVVCAVVFGPSRRRTSRVRNRILSELNGFLGKIPILVGGGLSCAIYYVACNKWNLGPHLNFSPVTHAPWFGLPTLTLPVFNERSIFLIAPVAIVLVAENFGHIRTISHMMDRNFDRYLGRAFMADGLATMLSGLFGGTGMTTYAENLGVMNLTKNYSTYTLFFAGIIAVCLGLSPKFGAAIRTIPTPIIGGLSFILFGLITATAGRIWIDGNVDFKQSRNLLVAGVTLVVGAGNLTWQFGGIGFGGIATATFTALILYHVIAGGRANVAPLMRG